MTAAESQSEAPRNDARDSSAPPHSGLEFRAFLFPEDSATSSSVDLTWVRAEPHQNVLSRSHSRPGLLVVLEGGATLGGRMSGLVRQGDVVVVPADVDYEFGSVGDGGLQAVHISFRETSGAGRGEVSTLDALLEWNEIRTQLILNNPFFLLWRECTLDDERKHRLMLECLAVLAATFGTILPARQEPSHDDERLRPSVGSLAVADPVLRATSIWYRHQMRTLDYAGKAAIHLVLETAGRYLGILAGPRLAGDDAARDVEAPAAQSPKHQDVYARLLAGEQPETFGHLHSVLDDTWDLLDEVTTRIASFVMKGD